MINKKHFGILAIIIIIIFTAYYWNNVYIHTPIEAINKTNIPFGKVLSEIKLEDSLLIFYRNSSNQNEICIAYEEKYPLSGWKYVGGGGAAKHETDGLSWCWSTLKHAGTDSDDLLRILFGEINNPAITSIKVKANIDTKLRNIKEPLIEKNAKIIKCSDTRLWYVITSENMPNAMKVYGYSDEGELIHIADDWGD